MDFAPNLRQSLFFFLSTVFLTFFEFYNKMEKSESKKYPYKSARIVEGERSYIEYYYWNDEKKKLVRKRTYKNVSQDTVDEINELLETGKYYLPSNSERQLIDREKNKSNILAVDALLLALEESKIRMRGKSTNSYKTHVNLFCKYLNENYEGIKLRDLKASIMTEFLNYYQKEKDWTAKTRNTYYQNISTLVNDLIKLDYITVNPFAGFKKQRESKSTSHRAYNLQQRQLLKETISKENPQLWLMCQIMFYSFARPNEIRQLKVGYLEIENNKIFIPAAITKNKTDSRIEMPVQLRQILIDAGIFDYHSDYYVLGKDGKPSKECYTRYWFSKRHKEFIDRLKFGKGYTLYSWKHTGVSEAYKNGLDAYAISQQCRHWDLSETNTYLRSLGLYSSQQIKNNFPTL